MARIRANRIKEVTTTVGTGNVTLEGAVAGFRTFGSAMANNDTCIYCIALRDSVEWEIGIGTYVSATPALARTTVIASSNSNNLVSFSSGTKDVFITEIAERLILPEITSVPSPPESGVSVWSRNRGGRFLPEFQGPSGIPSALQPALFGNAVAMWLAGSGTTVSIAFGTTWTVGATQAHPTISDTNIMSAMRRATLTTTTTAGNASGVRSVTPLVIRNRGFFFFARFGVLTLHSAMQIWVGLSNLSGLLAGDPSAQNFTICVGKDTADANWQIITRDGSAADKTNTGRAVAAAGNTQIFDFIAFCKPSDTKITTRLEDIGDNTVIVNNLEKTSNLPDGTTALYAHAECRNVTGGAGTAVAIFLSRIYVESDV